MAIVISQGTLTDQETTSNVGLPMSNSVVYYNGNNADYGTIYRTQPNLRLVVNFLARNIAQLGVKPFERISDTERLSLGDHALGQLIREPNPIIKYTHYRMIYSLVADLSIYDTAFLLKTRNENNGLMRLWRLPPEQMQPLEANPWTPTKWRWNGSPQRPVFDEMADLITFRGFNPTDQRYGMSPIEAIKQTLIESQASADYRAQFWRSGARISGVIQRPAVGQGTPRWSDEARERFETDWEARWAGAATTAGGTPLLEDGMTYNQISFSARDSEYLGARRLSREEVAAQYHISPLFVGILENANFSNVKEQHRHLYQDTLGPWLVQIQEGLQQQLVPEFPDLNQRSTYIEFDMSDKLKGSFEEVAAQLQTAVGAPWMTRNEARAADNKPPIPGGDEIVTPLNMQVGAAAPPPQTAAQRRSPLKSVETKAITEMPQEFRRWALGHADLMRDYFGAQSDALLAHLGSGAAVGDVWDDAYWNANLQTSLMGMAQNMGAVCGAAIAAQFSGQFDPARMDPYLAKNTTIAAESINLTTRQQLAAALGDSDAVRSVFEVASSSRADQIGTSRATAVGNFSQSEGALQGGAGRKRWIVNSRNSRHPDLSGQVVDIDKAFSNGARWPGDHSLNISQRSGCVCGLEFV